MSSSSSWSTLIARRSPGLSMELLRDTRDEARLDRQLGGGEREGLFGDLDRHAVDFEQNAARLDARDPEFRRALAGAHAHFERLLRHRHVREQPDPDLAGTLHVTRERTPRRLDLARGDAIGLHRLQAVLPEVEVGRAG